jgi:sulfate adenylyltransferase subunit 2|tara:strand:- start:2930 stop:3838 length:909 start_codon:yes stop_codon:yes gene_type:complete
MNDIYYLNYLEELESESIYIFREAFSQFENPVILFSGGKDSIVLTHIAEKAFYPKNFIFPLLHIDTGHNFKETIDFRDKLVRHLNTKLIIGSVQESIDQGKVIEEKGIFSSRNRLQTSTLLDCINDHNIDCAIGGGRRDEEKSRSKERIFSHRDDFGQWNPKNQRPELWNHYNGKLFKGEHFRVFPLSNWTELDIWNYIKKERIEVPKLYFSHSREVIKRQDSLIPNSEFIKINNDEKIEIKKVRFRTLGDITITGGIESKVTNIDGIIKELDKMVFSERGNRSDDKISETSMEDRKKDGYF